MADSLCSRELRRGYTPFNDYIIDSIKPHIKGDYLDIGCNTGWLLSEVRSGMGVDKDKYFTKKAKAKGLKVFTVNADNLPFAGNSFNTAVLSMVLHENEDWEAILREALNVSRHVIGITPASKNWYLNGPCVKSFIPMEYFKPRNLVDKGYGSWFSVMARSLDYDVYFFDITRH